MAIGKDQSALCVPVVCNGLTADGSALSVESTTDHKLVRNDQDTTSVDTMFKYLMRSRPLRWLGLGNAQAASPNP